jgi:hypothetical protein
MARPSVWDYFAWLEQEHAQGSYEDRVEQHLEQLRVDHAEESQGTEAGETGESPDAALR